MTVYIRTSSTIWDLNADVHCFFHKLTLTSPHFVSSFMGSLYCHKITASKFMLLKLTIL